MIENFNSALNEMLAFVEQEARKIETLMNALRTTLKGRPLALFGRWSLVGQQILDACSDYGMEAACFCNFDGECGIVESKSGKAVPLIDTTTLLRDFPEATVVICSYFRKNDAVMDLVQHGFSGQRLVPWEWAAKIVRLQLFLDVSNSYHIHIDKYSWAFDLFKDEVSKQTLLDRLRLYLCGTKIKKNSMCSQYFEDGLITLGEREIFVDGGAHNGESAIEFIEQIKSAGGGYAHVYSFEPGPGNFKEAVKNISNYPNVTVIQKGLWNMETELTFFDKQDTLGSSFVNVPDKPEESGNIVQNVPVTSLDTFFSEIPKSDWPTFIKMDIEGAEREALLGAANIIGRVKPKLAICTYHKPEDIYVLPKTIMRIRSDYEFALRHYNDGPYETVLYAV